MTDHPIHFEGCLPNASGTPRGEVGGLAVPSGVMMLSRTGYAIAVRRPDGAVALRQVPFRSLRRGQKKGTGFLRNAGAALEQFELSRRGLREAQDFLGQEGATPEQANSGGEQKESSLGIVLLAAVAAFVLLPNLLTEALGVLLGQRALLSESASPVLFHLISGGLRILLLVGYLGSLFLNPGMRNIFHYHGAEHKAVLALEEGRDVTVARARRHDTLHRRCGTNFVALLLVLAIIAFPLLDVAWALVLAGWADWHWLGRKVVQLATQGASLPLLALAALELLRWAARQSHTRWGRVIFAPGFALQRLTTQQPSDAQLEVAIVALFGALAISPADRRARDYVVAGLEDDETAPGYRPRSPARPAAADSPPGTGEASPVPG